MVSIIRGLESQGRLYISFSEARRPTSLAFIYVCTYLHSDFWDHVHGCYSEIKKHKSQVMHMQIRNEKNQSLCDERVLLPIPLNSHCFA